MTNFVEQLKALRLSRYQVILQAQRETVLLAIIGATLRGAFGHQWKAIACQLPAGERGGCLLEKTCQQPENCLYAKIFEPKFINEKNKETDAPRPFIFEPPIPPLTQQVSDNPNSILKRRIFKDGKIAFGLTLFGHAIDKLQYLIYAIELFAKQGIGGYRQRFNLVEISSLDEIGNKYLIYTEKKTETGNNYTNSLAELVEKRLNEINLKDKLKIRFLIPLRLRKESKCKNKKTNDNKLVSEINFGHIFEFARRRLVLMMKIYGKPLEYDFNDLKEKAGKIKTVSNRLWQHDYKRWSGKQEKELPLDGMLGEIEFEGESMAELLPFIVAGEILHIGSTTSFGLGKYEIIS